MVNLQIMHLCTGKSYVQEITFFRRNRSALFDVCRKPATLGEIFFLLNALPLKQINLKIWSSEVNDFKNYYCMLISLEFDSTIYSPSI